MLKVRRSNENPSGESNGSVPLRWDEGYSADEPCWCLWYETWHSEIIRFQLILCPVLERFFSRKERQKLFRSWAGSASMWIKVGVVLGFPLNAKPQQFLTGWRCYLGKRHLCSGRYFREQSYSRRTDRLQRGCCWRGCFISQHDLRCCW